ncbi:DUF5709 domain-containing protein [Nocardioides marmorisolisilvae]|uniref:DUF5709 domain-containing protein n=1 Tax=Nocardioides marmorisolisilvae TaxID=1542737 RepID=A0A3N0DSL4_9ACTN|nr:DUF5709 domain-containing protein [Nocardioides marmorisolisilvae]RNL78620.1 hypothetical protein EFL95_05905 [Nocardioides marmorisolisilvae]
MTEDQLQPEDTLEDRGVEDVLDEGYSPPDREPANLRRDPGAEPSLDDRLAAEEPEPDPYAEADHDPGRADPRAGRLVAPDEGLAADTEKDSVAEDVGIDGAGASAEEAAVHVVEEDEVGPETEPDRGPLT